MPSSPKSDILKTIYEYKVEEVVVQKQQTPLEFMKDNLQSYPLLPFKEKLLASNIGLIAEIKRKSPSKGLLKADFDHLGIADIYDDAGVDCISILTDEYFFGGHLSYLSEIKNKVYVPLLRKDFIIDPYQIYQARYYGADAILLIVDMLARDKIFEFHEIARSIGLDCLIEIHSEEDLNKLSGIKDCLIGINNRNLHSFEVSLDICLNLKPLIPDGLPVVAESGIHNHQDIKVLMDAGFTAVLIGEALMTSQDIDKKINDLFQDLR